MQAIIAALAFLLEQHEKHNLNPDVTNKAAELKDAIKNMPPLEDAEFIAHEIEERLIETLRNNAAEALQLQTSPFPPTTALTDEEKK